MQNCYFYRNGKLWKLTAVEDVKADKKEQKENYTELPSFEEEDRAVEEMKKSLAEAKKEIDTAFAGAVEAIESYKRCSAVYKKLESKVPASKKDAAIEVVNRLRDVLDVVWDEVDYLIGVCDNAMSDVFYASPYGKEG